MKSFYALIIISGLLPVACSKNDDNTPDISKMKIASISGLGEFKYKEDRLTSIGNEIFFYNASGQIAGSRIHQKDTIQLSTPSVYAVSEKLERSTYVWENKRLKQRVADTVLSKFYRLNQLEKDPINSCSLLTYFLADRFYTKGDQLDSVFYAGTTASSGSKKISYEYNSAGNIIKVVEIASNHNTYWSVPMYQSSRTETEIVYDNNPNPFYYLYKQTGVILNKLKGFSFSVNNPVKFTMTTNQFGQPITVTKEIRYEYNSIGFPIKIKTQDPYKGEQIVSIAYR